MKKTEMKKTSCVRTKGLSAALVTFFISSHAFSISQINSDFELVLPRQFQQNLIEKKWETLVNKEFEGNWQFPDQQVLSQDVPVQIKGISLKIKTQLQKPALTEGKTVLDLTSKNLRAELNIAEVSVDHIVEREVGGIIGRFRIQAHCRNVVLNLAPGKGSFSVQVAPSIESSQAGTEVQSVDLSWQPGSWTARAIQCDGVQGFADIIKTEISKITNDSSSFVTPKKELLKQYVQNYLKNVQIDFSQARELIVSRPDIRILMRADEYKDLGDAGARLKGTLQIQFTALKDEPEQTLKLSANDSVTTGTQAQLRLPKDFIREVMKRAYAGNSWLHEVSSSRIPGFSTLMNSRFYQFFIWPELMRFSKSTQFRFQVYSNKDVDIQGEGLQYQVKAQILSKMQAPKSGSYVPFMNFTVPFSSKVQIKVSNGQAQAYFANPSMSLSPQWDSSYVNRYHPYRSFSSGTIRDKIISALWGKTVSVAIPQIPLTEGLALKVNKLSTTTGQELLLQLSP